MRKNIRNWILNALGKFSRPRNGVHILNSHFAKFHKSDSVDTFINFVKNLNECCQLVNFSDALSLINDLDRIVEKPLVALTFDDGFYECYSDISMILNQVGISACFFINAGVIDCDAEYDLSFRRRVDCRDRGFVSWDDLRDMTAKGHIIGSHTVDHFDLSSLADDEVERQISVNKNILQTNLDCDINNFAWPYGRLKSFPENALRLAGKYHNNIFSGDNYKYYHSYDGQVINRRHVEPYWPFSHVKHFISVDKT